MNTCAVACLIGIAAAPPQTPGATVGEQTGSVRNGTPNAGTLNGMWLNGVTFNGARSR
jgi:hypothetical protein